MNKAEAIEKLKNQESLKEVAIEATKDLQDLTGDEVKLWAGLAPMIVGGDAMDDEHSDALATMFTAVATQTSMRSLCDCASIALKYDDVVSLYAKSRYARTPSDFMITDEMSNTAEFAATDTVNKMLRMDYGDTGICDGIESAMIMLVVDEHIAFMARWWTTYVTPEEIAQHNNSLSRTIATELDLSDILPEKRDAAVTALKTIATGASVGDIMRACDEAMVDVDQEMESDVLTEQDSVEESAQPVGGSSTAHAIESIVVDQAAAIDAENAETIAALQRELDAAQDVFDQNSARAVAVSAPSGGGSSSSSDGMSGWAVAGLCIAAAGAAYLGYRFFTDGDSQDIVDVDIDDYV